MAQVNVNLNEKSVKPMTSESANWDAQLFQIDFPFTNANSNFTPGTIKDPELTPLVKDFVKYNLGFTVVGIVDGDDISSGYTIIRLVGRKEDLTKYFNLPIITEEARKIALKHLIKVKVDRKTAYSIIDVTE